MAKEAMHKNATFEAVYKETDRGNILLEEAVLSRDNSKKAYYKEFRKVVEAADVILEVLDARDPLGCRTGQIEEMILNSGVNKRIILILNKVGKKHSMH